MNIFVGNLSFSSTDADVKRLFGSFGGVASVAIVKDKKGVKSRGFGFVEMPDQQQAEAAIAALEGKEFMGRLLNVSPAHPKSETVRREEKETPFARSSRRAGKYKTGRRSRRFMMRLAAEGKEIPPLRRKIKVNPMRWPKKQDQSKPWQDKNRNFQSGMKSRMEDGAKPWKKAGESKPSWKKTGGESKPPWVKKKMYGIQKRNKKKS